VCGEETVQSVFLRKALRAEEEHVFRQVCEAWQVTVLELSDRHVYRSSTLVDGIIVNQQDAESGTIRCDDVGSGRRGKSPVAIGTIVYQRNFQIVGVPG
jgi:hypothetical protein